MLPGGTPTHVGGYRLLGLLGRGGMGAVYRAESVALRRVVALKVLSAPSNPKLVERFMLEARSAARVKHPNVVVVHEVGKDGPMWFLAMDLVEGSRSARRSSGAGRSSSAPLPEPPRALRSEIDRDLETITLRALEKEPAARYDTAAELADDLERWVLGEPITARRAGVGGRLAKWAARRPGSAISLAAAGLAALIVSTAELVERRVQGRAVADARRDAIDQVVAKLRLGHARNLESSGKR